MPKMKTKRATAKRIKKTGSGKLIHQKCGGSHILTKKSRKRKRRLRKKTVISKAMNPRNRIMIQG